MIINLGQQRSAREGIRTDEVFLPTNWELPAETLHTSEVIAGLIAQHYESPMQYGRVASIKLADGQIRPDQRFYDREIEIAAQILAARSPATETAQNWYLLMKREIGYRVVPVPFCSYGDEPHPVSRQCVTKGPEVDWQPEPEREPEKEPKAKSSLILPLAIVGIVGLALIGGTK